jgi:hypothetical protein
MHKISVHVDVCSPPWPSLPFSAARTIRANFLATSCSHIHLIHLIHFIWYISRLLLLPEANLRSVVRLAHVGYLEDDFWALKASYSRIQLTSGSKNSSMLYGRSKRLR